MGKDVNLKIKAATEFSGRRLSISEYYHACLGVSGKTLETVRENVIVIEGLGALNIDALRVAVAKASQFNPGSRIRMAGNLFFARWLPDGASPSVRVEDDCCWDGASDAGSDFIYRTPLSASAGVTSEFIVARSRDASHQFLIFRNLHSIMDGMGFMHFLREVFRALRGEPLQGTNAFFRDADLMRAVPSDPSAAMQYQQLKNEKPAYATGGPRGAEVGDTWQRLTLQGPMMWTLARVAAAIAEFAHLFSDAKVRIIVPVNLRRHLPEIRSTLNFTAAQHVDLDKGDSAAKFQQRLHQALKNNGEIYYRPAMEMVRALPLSWLERITCRTPKNYLSHRILETTVISDLGEFKSSELSADGFAATALFGVPLPGNTFGLLSTLDDRISLVIGMPKVYANDGRLEALVDHIVAKLA